jgi:Spy/CpxP family protein refolding chaperone
VTKGKWMWAVAAAVGGAVVATDLATAASSMDAPATQPATTRPARMGRKKGLVQPWSEMKTLTPQQQDQIVKLHEDALAQTHKIEEKETDDIMALLTPEQQAEVADIKAKSKETMKERSAARRKGAAATQPAM